VSRLGFVPLVLTLAAACGSRLAPETSAGAPAETLFFVGCRDRCGLWATEGTAESTRLLVESRYIHHLVAASGRGAWFGLLDELWTSDGTPTGTVKVVDVKPGFTPDPAFGVERYGPSHLTAVDESVFLMVGERLWVSDGTAGGTRQVTIETEDEEREVELVGENDGALLLTTRRGSGRSLWRVSPKDLAPRRLEGTVVVEEGKPARLGRTLFMSGSDWYDNEPAKGLVAVGGATAAIAALMHTGDGAPSPPVATRSALFFVADDGVHGRELWTSRGTPATTHMVAELWPGRDQSRPPMLMPAETSLYFVAPPSTGTTEPKALWVTDGTRAGTRELARLPVENRPTAALADRLLFWVRGEGASQLFVSGGTAAGTRRLTGLPNCQTAGPLVAFNGRVMASCSEGVWSTDGTDGGTTKLDFLPSFDVYAVAGKGVARRGLTETSGAAADGREVETVLRATLIQGFGSNLGSKPESVVEIEPRRDLGGFVALARVPPALHVIHARGDVQTIALPAEPLWLDLSPTGRRAVVGLAQAELAVVDLWSQAVTFSGRVSPRPGFYGGVEGAAVPDDGNIVVFSGTFLWNSHGNSGPFDPAGFNAGLGAQGLLHPSGSLFVMPSGSVVALEGRAEWGQVGPAPQLPAKPEIDEAFWFLDDSSLIDRAGSVFAVSPVAGSTVARRGKVEVPTSLQMPAATDRSTHANAPAITSAVPGRVRGEALLIAAKHRLRSGVSAGGDQILAVDIATLRVTGRLDRFAYRRDGRLRFARPVRVTPLSDGRLLALLEEVDATSSSGCWQNPYRRNCVSDWLVGEIELAPAPRQ